MGVLRKRLNRNVKELAWPALICTVFLAASCSGATTEGDPTGAGRNVAPDTQISGASEVAATPFGGSPAEADLPEELPESPLSAYLDGVAGVPEPDAELQLFADELARCMRNEGFDYVSYIAPTPDHMPGELHDSLPTDEGSYEWISVYGFGISTLAFDQRQLSGDLTGHPGIPELEDIPADPNSIYYNELGPSDQAAFDRAMWGQDSEGCQASAYRVSGQAYAVQEAFFEQFRNAARDIDERVEADARVFNFVEDLRACVESTGHTFIDMEGVFNRFQPPVDLLLSRLPADPIDQLDEAEIEAMTEEERQELYDQSAAEPQLLPEEYYSELAEVQNEEIALAVAVYECGSLRTLNNLRQVVRSELEEQFIADNEGLLIAFAEAHTPEPADAG